MDKLPEITPPGTVEEIARIVRDAKTFGHRRFEEAEGYLRKGKYSEAIDAFESLKVDFPGTWFDQVSCERLAELQNTGGED